jgi:hypothetical protein
MQRFTGFCCACILTLGLALAPASGSASPNSGFVIVEASGGGDPGEHKGECSPAHVTLAGSKPGPNQFAVYDGCAQTIYCATAVDTVEADAKDSIQGKCGYVQRH